MNFYMPNANGARYSGKPTTTTQSGQPHRKGQTPMVTVAQTAETLVFDKITATDMRAFLNAVPGDAEITINPTPSSGMKPAGFQIKATWTKVHDERPNLVRPPAMRTATAPVGLTHESGNE